MWGSELHCQYSGKKNKWFSVTSTDSRFLWAFSGQKKPKKMLLLKPRLSFTSTQTAVSFRKVLHRYLKNSSNWEPSAATIKTVYQVITLQTSYGTSLFPEKTWGSLLLCEKGTSCIWRAWVVWHTQGKKREHCNRRRLPDCNYENISLLMERVIKRVWRAGAFTHCASSAATTLV